MECCDKKIASKYTVGIHSMCIFRNILSRADPAKIHPEYEKFRVRAEKEAKGQEQMHKNIHMMKNRMTKQIKMKMNEIYELLLRQNAMFAVQSCHALHARKLRLKLRDGESQKRITEKDKTTQNGKIKQFK